MPTPIDSYDEVLKVNDQWLDKFSKSDFMQLIASQTMDNLKVRNKLMDGIQILSNCFQKTMLLRVVLIENNPFLSLAEEHLTEEFGHNHLLNEERNHRQIPWDVILDSTTAWLIWKMFTLNNIEKTFLIHFVLEGSAQLFFTQANLIMKKYGGSKYFVIHSQNDERHEQMGRKCIENLREEEYKAIHIIMNQAWDVMITICNRIAYLATGE